MWKYKETAEQGVQTYEESIVETQRGSACGR